MKKNSILMRMSLIVSLLMLVGFSSLGFSKESDNNTKNSIVLQNDEKEVVTRINKIRSLVKSADLKVSQELVGIATSQAEKVLKNGGELKFYFPDFSIEKFGKSRVNFSVTEDGVLKVEDSEKNELYSQVMFIGSSRNSMVFFQHGDKKDFILNKNYKYIGIKKVNDLYVIVMSELASFDEE